jgi:hypothetical protein
MRCGAAACGSGEGLKHAFENVPFPRNAAIFAFLLIPRKVNVRRSRRPRPVGIEALNLMNEAIQEHDTPWKEIIESLFPRFIEFFFPDAYCEIDWSREPTFMDKELP